MLVCIVGHMSFNYLSAWLICSSRGLRGVAGIPDTCFFFFAPLCLTDVEAAFFAFVLTVSDATAVSAWICAGVAGISATELRHIAKAATDSATMPSAMAPRRSPEVYFPIICLQESGYEHRGYEHRSHIAYKEHQQSDGVCLYRALV